MPADEFATCVVRAYDHSPWRPNSTFSLTGSGGSAATAPNCCPGYLKLSLPRQIARSEPLELTGCQSGGRIAVIGRDPCAAPLKYRAPGAPFVA